MPRLPINYKNAVVYKICCKNVNITYIYVGSTTNFKNRKSHHKGSCNNEKNKSYKLCVYSFIRLNGGWDNFDMIEIEKVVDCNDANELRKRERYYIETLKAELNKNIPSRTPEEYRIDNKEEIREKVKEFRIEHTDQFRDRGINYRRENADIIKEKRRIYEDKNREKIDARNKLSVEKFCKLNNIDYKLLK